MDTRLTREVNGMGLRLAICKRNVELHSGTILAESEVGKGSIFHLWLLVDGRNLEVYAQKGGAYARKENDHSDR